MAETFQRPGWYPDPEGAPGERWWNGSSWSDSKRGGGAGGPVIPTPLTPTNRYPQPAAAAVNAPVPTRPDPYAPPQTFAQAAPRGIRGIDMNSNRNAMIGFVTGVVGLFVGLIPFIGIVAIVFSILGIRTATRLQASGAGSASMVFAIIGLLTGILTTVIGIITVAVFISALVAPQV